MTAPAWSVDTADNFNHLRTGTTYSLVTVDGEKTIGIYRGIEVEYGQWRVLIEHGDGIDSIPVRLVRSALPIAA